MSERFYAAAVDGSQAVLDGSEAHHLKHVMRADLGTKVILFDGSGREYTARIARMGRSDIGLNIEQCAEVDRELGRQVTLAVALPKGDRQRYLVEKAVELGVARLLPIGTQRGVAQPAAAALSRLERTVIEACKQCGRNRLMKIEQPRAFVDFVSEDPHDAVRLIAHPGGVPLRTWFDEDLASRKSDTGFLCAVGPEGGFTQEEVNVATDRGWRIVDLGPRTLRVETAAVTLAAFAAFR